MSEDKEVPTMWAEARSELHKIVEQWRGTELGQAVARMGQELLRESLARRVSMPVLDQVAKEGSAGGIPPGDLMKFREQAAKMKASVGFELAVQDAVSRVLRCVSGADGASE